jgi:integrase/recombinase XerC
VKQASIRFEQYLNRRYNGSSTAKHYLSDLAIFIQTIGDEPPQSVTPADIDTFINTQIAAGLGPTTINRRLASLRAFFEYLAGEDVAQDWPNPVIWKRHGLKTGEHLPRDVSEDEVNRLFAVITDARDRAMFGLMVGAGLRVGEVCALCLDSLEPPSAPDQLARLRVQGKGNKERVVWCTPSVWNALEDWLALRSLVVANDRVFLNRRGNPITVSGIQYCLKQYCQQAGVRLTCHRLRHTFARRMTEQGLPVDSLAKLLGHAQIQTTQRYIDGADPTVRADFTAAMDSLEMMLINLRSPDDEDGHSGGMPEPPKAPPPTRPLVAPQTELDKLRLEFEPLPAWLREVVDAYITWRWPSWRPQSAYRAGRHFFYGVQRFWLWLGTHRTVTGWGTLRRADLEAWMTARCQSGVTNGTIQAELAQVRTLLRFAEARDLPVEPGLFRVQAPRRDYYKLPRYLPEIDYRRLEAVVLKGAQKDPYDASFDRAWFLMFAHTGLRRSELLELRLDDLDLVKGTALVRDGKFGRDRVVYLTPPLMLALDHYLTLRPALPDEDHVFILHDRVPAPETIRRRLELYGQQVGVQVSPHRLRHTFATRLLNQGMPITSLQKLLGHKHLDMTLRYAQVYDATLYSQFQTVVSQLEGILVEEWPSIASVQRESPVKLDNSV